MTTANLIKALRAVEAYSNNDEIGVIITEAIAHGFASRYIIVKGVRRAFHRVYVVDCSTPNGFVFEIMGGHAMTDEELIDATVRNQFPELYKFD